MSAQRSPGYHTQTATNNPCLEEPSLNRKEEPLRNHQPLKDHSNRNKHRLINSYKLNCSMHPLVTDSMVLRMVERLDCICVIVMTKLLYVTSKTA